MIETSPTESSISGAPSSLVIVPMPVSSTMETEPETLLMMTKKLSVGSKLASPFMVTVNVLLVCPAGMVWPVKVFAT